MMLRSRLLLTLLVAGCVAVGGVQSTHAQSTHAQSTPADATSEPESFTEHLFVHVHGALQGHDIASNEVDNGGGFGLKLGYGFTPTYTLYVGLDVAGMATDNPQTAATFGDDYALVYVDIGSQFNFRSGEKAVPYLDVALTGVASGTDQGGTDVTLSGSGLSVGGGVKYFLSPAFALDGALHLSTGGYRESDVNGDTRDIDASYFGTRLQAGLSWYPFR